MWEYIKKQLDAGVKKYSCILFYQKSDYWSALGSSILKMDRMRSSVLWSMERNLPAAAKKINPNIEDDAINGDVQYKGYNGYNDTLFRDGHAVSIVGYDNSGFIIKTAGGLETAAVMAGWVLIITAYS